MAGGTAAKRKRGYCEDERERKRDQMMSVWRRELKRQKSPMVLEGKGISDSPL